MLPSSLSGSIGGVSRHAAAVTLTATQAHSASRRGARSTTRYHSVVIPGPRPTLRIATYNVHRCRGLDGRTRPDRIAGVLRAIDADVVALQEVVGAGPNGG